MRQFGNGQILANAHIEVAHHWFSVSLMDRAIHIEDEEAGLRHIIDMQELTARLA